VPRGLVLVDHGSRRDEANAVLSVVADLVRDRGESDLLVRYAHMELAAPTIDEAIDACVAGGASAIVVVPYFLAPGRHASHDIPLAVAEAAKRHPTIPMRVTEPLGIHPLLADVVLERSRS